MKKCTLISFFAVILCFAACRHEAVPVVPDDPAYEMEDVFLSASVSDDQTKVDFEYNSGLYMKWHGDEQLHVFIKHANGTIEQPEAGIIDCVPGTLSDDKFSLDFAGSVRARQNPETDKFVFMYADIETIVVGGVQKVKYNYDLNKQTVVVNGSDEGIGDIKNHFPITFEYDGDGNLVVSKRACVIKIIASGLPANAKVTGLTIFAGTDNVIFPKLVDVTTFNYLEGNKSNSLSYAFENAFTNNSGEVTLYVAAPIVPGAKNCEINVVCEKDGEYQTKKAVKNITGESALSESKLYKLTRNDWAGGINPGTVVGDPEDNMESIVGQWDKTGYLSNDIYGVLDLGKPENLSLEHNAIINLIQKAYTKTSSDNDLYVHPAAVLAAGKQGYAEKAHDMTSDGPQYVRAAGDYSQAEDLTFNNIVLKESTQLYMTFVDSKAWNTNTIGYYCYPTDQENSYKTQEGHANIHEMVVFPSTSQNLTDPTVTHKFNAKTTAMLLYPQYDSEHALTGAMKKEFDAGTTVGIFGYTNGLDTSKDFALLPLTSTSGCKGVHYTNIAWNRRNWFSPDEENRPYWNQIAVLRVIMPGQQTPRTDCLIVTMKDEYTWHGSGQDARTWTNPILLIYATNPNAIDFTAGDRSDRWTSSVNLNGLTFGISYDLDGVTSTNTETSFKGSYQSTIKVANTEFGSFCNFSVVAGGVDITEHVVSFNAERTQAEVNIPRTKAAGEIKITAHAAKNVMVQSLTASQLMELAEQTGDLPTYRLILHCSTQSSGSVAFGLDKNRSYCRTACPFADKIYTTPTHVKVEDQYNDYEWSLEKAIDSEGRFVGFKLKKVTKITDTEVTVDGYIMRDPAGNHNVRLADSGTILSAEAIEGCDMWLKSQDSAYQYMVCAFGYNLQTAVFWYSGNHVKNYGKWRVYKVWLEDAPAGN